MDFSQQIKNSRNANVSTTFQNHRYQLPRRIAKTIIIDSIGHSLDTDVNWSVIFKEPLMIDCLSDIFLDSITTYKILNNITSNTYGDFMGILFNINQFNITSNSASKSENKVDSTTNISSTEPVNINHFNRIFIPNKSTDDTKVFVHKEHKSDFIATINPCKLTKLTGSISNLANNPIFTSNGRFVAEFTIISRLD